MSTHDDRQHEKDIAALRRDYASLSRNEPRLEIDTAIRAAAKRNMRQRHLPAWGAAAGLAACVGLAVVLVPALLVEAPREVAQTRSTELVLQLEPVASDRAVQRKQRETAALRENVARPAAAPALVEGKGERSMAYEEWIAREEIAPETLHSSKPVIADDVREAEEGAKLAGLDTNAAHASAAPERVVVTGSRVRTEDAETAAPHIENLRAELANADEATWRNTLLKLREQGDEAVAQELLTEFRVRFKRPANFTLVDLARESSRAGTKKE